MSSFPMRLERGGGHKRGLDLCLNLGCARERSSVRKSGWKGRVWPYSPGRVDRVDPVDPRIPRVYSGPQAGRYEQTRTASAAVRCSVSQLKYQGKQFPTDQYSGGAVLQVPGGVAPQVQGGAALQVSGGAVPKYQEEQSLKYQEVQPFKNQLEQFPSRPGGGGPGQVPGGVEDTVIGRYCLKVDTLR